MGGIPQIQPPMQQPVLQMAPQQQLAPAPAANNPQALLGMLTPEQQSALLAQLLQQQQPAPVAQAAAPVETKEPVAAETKEEE